MRMLPYAGEIYEIYLKPSHQGLGFGGHLFAAVRRELARVHLDDEDGPEVGGAWKRVGERAGDYIALEIDSPLFPAAFRPVLFRADDDGRTFRLSWKRPRPRDDRS